MFFYLISDPPPVLRVDDRQRLARERREEREKQLGISTPGWSLRKSTVVDMVLPLQENGH